MGLREQLLALKPNATVKAVTLSNGVTVCVPRLSIGDMIRLEALKDDQGGMLALMVRDAQGGKVLEAAEAAEMFLPADATKIINECTAFNAVPAGEGDSPNP